MVRNVQAFIDRSVHALQSVEQEKQKFVLHRLCDLAKQLSDYEQHLAIKSWTAIQIPETLIRLYLRGEDESVTESVREIVEFLSDYDITFDEITKTLSITKDKRSFTTDELIFSAVQIGIENPAGKIKLLINHKNTNITVVKKYNSLKNYLQSLADKYRGEKLVDELCSCIPAYDFGDKSAADFYQNRLERLFPKWLVKAGGQALGLTTNDVMLLWIDPVGGAGKSYLNNWLFSLPEMKKYYMPIRENKSYFPMEEYSSSMVAVDWDELPLSSSRYLMFKSYIAAESGKFYNKRTGRNESYERIMSFIGSTNKGNRNNHPGFLLDDDDAMKRRILAFEINRINYKKYMNEIDLEQLWGEIIYRALNTFQSNKNALTWESDWTDFREYNSRYVNEAMNIDRLIHDKLKKPTGNDGAFYSASELLNLFPACNLSPEQFAHKLEKLGFSHRSTYIKRGWYVKIVSN